MTIHKAEQRSTRPEGNPIEQMVYDVQNAIKAGQENLALQHFYRLAQLNPDKKNIINIQETWVVKDGTRWVETTTRPDQKDFDQTAAAIKRINGLKLSRLQTERRLKLSQKRGASLIQLSKEIYCTGEPADEDVFGYQERWAEYRYHPSLITGRFRSTAASTLDSWHLAQKFASRPVLNDTFIIENPPIS